MVAALYVFLNVLGLLYLAGLQSRYILNCIFIFAIVFFFVLLCFMFIYTSAFPDIHALAEKSLLV